MLSNSIKLRSAAAFTFAVLTVAFLTGCGAKLPTSTGGLNLSSVGDVVSFSSGTFASNFCFLNRPASEGMGQPIHTRASLVFNADGTGQSNFDLYTDSACVTPAMSGSATFAYEIVATYGSVVVIRVNQQNDPSDPSNVSQYYLAAAVSTAGLTMDIDFTDGNSGPYTTEPTEAELSALIANPSAEGILFSLQ